MGGADYLADLHARGRMGISNPSRNHCPRGHGPQEPYGYNGNGLGDTYMCGQCGARWSDTNQWGQTVHGSAELVWNAETGAWVPKKPKQEDY